MQVALPNILDRWLTMSHPVVRAGNRGIVFQTKPENFSCYDLYKLNEITLPV